MQFGFFRHVEGPSGRRPTVGGLALDESATLVFLNIT